nr:retrovirus-related Pol polyprotein from transposon TNT 1-94 [Tanacetum cinerariifolium]
MMASSPICLLSKASKTKSWLWHRRLSHLNFGAINHLARQGLVRGLSKLKFEKDHLCSACAMGKSTKKTQKPKSEDTNQEKLYLLHIDLCGPMRVESVNGKKYILVIVDDYSRFTWVKFLRSKDETPMFIIKFLKMIQVRLNVPIRRIRTDNGTEFVNQTVRDYYEEVGISHETSVARSPQQNGVVERRNCTLIKAARTMLIYTQAPLFLWAEGVATVCFTQNRSIIQLRHRKTLFELLHSKLPDLSFFHVFGALCYPTNDRLVRTSSSSTSFVPPLRNNWDLLFQSMFDELLNPPPSVVNQAAEVIAPIAEVIPQVDDDSTGSPSSTTVDQDAHSPSKSLTPIEPQSPVSRQDEFRTMATIIDQQVALDEALVPSTKRLRIGRSNFRLPSDIQSKESTLQVVYDVLRRCPFFQPFLVTVDVPEIYMQEFWATAIVHHHSIRFKMNNKKHIINLETFRDMLHICPRVPGQSFDELPFEAKILEFFSRNIDYAFLIWEDFVYQIEHKKQKKGIEMYYPRFTKEEKGDSDTSLTPLIATPTPKITDAPVSRLSTAAKGKRPTRVTTHTEPTNVERTEAEQLKIVLKQSRQEMHISQQRSFEEELSWNSFDDEDGGDEVSESKGESDEEETRQEKGECFDPIPRTPKGSEDEGNDEEDQDIRLSEEA